MNFKKPYLFIYDTGEIDTFKDTKNIIKKVSPEDFATGKLFKIAGDGNYKDLMIVDTLNGMCAYTDLQEALEAQAGYRSETIEEFIEEKEADVDILTHPEKYSDVDIVQEVMKAFDFVGNEGTEEFVQFLKVEPISDDVQEELQDYMGKGLEEVRFKQSAEKRLEEFKVELDNYFGDTIGAEVYSNPLLRVKNYQFEDSYIDLDIFVSPDGTLKARPIHDEMSKEQRTIESPEDVSNFMEDLIPLAEEQRQKDKAWREFKKETEEELKDLCRQEGATNVYVFLYSPYRVHLDISAYNDNGFMFGYELEEDSNKIKLYKKYEGRSESVPSKIYNKMSYPEAVDLLKDYIKNYSKQMDSSKKQTRISKVLTKLSKKQTRLSKVLKKLNVKVSDTSDLSKYATDNYGDDLDKAYSKAKEGGKQQQKIINLRYGRDIMNNIKKIFDDLGIKYGDSYRTEGGRLYGGYGHSAGYPEIYFRMPDSKINEKDDRPWFDVTIEGDLTTKPENITIKLTYYDHYAEDRGIKDIIKIKGDTQPSEQEVLDALEEAFNKLYVPIWGEGEVKNLNNFPKSFKEAYFTDWVPAFLKELKEKGSTTVSPDLYINQENIKISPEFFDTYGIKSLEYFNFPDSVENFSCRDCNIKTLKGAPKEVLGNFNCGFSGIESLEGTPNYVGGDFIIRDCDGLTNFEGCPENIGGDINFEYCHNLKSLKGLPSHINGSLYLDNYNHIKSLEYLPSYIGGDLTINSSHISLEDFKFLPKEIKGDLNIDYLVLDGYSKEKKKDILQPYLKKCKVGGNINIYDD